MKSAVKERKERGREEKKEKGGREREERGERGVPESLLGTEAHHIIAGFDTHLRKEETATVTRHTSHASSSPDHHTRNTSGYSGHFSLTQVKVSSSCILLCKWAALLFQLLAVSLNVFHHEVFPGQFIVVGEVTYHPAACVHTDTQTHRQMHIN